MGVFCFAEIDLGTIFTILSTIMLGVIGICISYRFSRINKKREEDRFLKEIFLEYNSKYGRVNEHLKTATEKEDISQLNSKEINAIIDYFNICAEEYFWYSKGRINDERVWRAWKAGMKYWYKHNIIKEMWKREIQSKDGIITYYLENGNEFFHD